MASEARRGTPGSRGRRRQLIGTASRLAAVLAAALALAACESGAVDPRSRLLALQDTVRRAHLDYDAELLAGLFADTLTTIEAGRVESVSREEARRRFRGYFERSTFLSWSDLEPPSVTVAPSGGLAVVRVRRSVRLGIRDSLGRARVESSVFAWAETWEKRARAWRLRTVTSTRAPGPADPGRPERDARPQWRDVDEAGRPEATLERARARVLVGRSPESVRSLAYVARGASPGGPFATRLWTDRRGAARFHQLTSSRDTVRLRLGAASLPVDGSSPDDVSPGDRAFVQGHDLLWMAVDPVAALGPPRRVGRATFAGEDADLVEFRDAAERPLELAYAARSGRLLGARVRVGEGDDDPVVLYLSGWRITDGLRLPRRAVFLQGHDPYLYRLTEIRVNHERAAFQP